MSEHTPLPWKLDGSVIRGSESIHTNGRERNKLGISSASYSEMVCELYGALELPGPRANAAFIVQACNSHAALVEALIYLLNETEDYIKINHLSALHNHSLEMARKALAMAKGTP